MTELYCVYRIVCFATGECYVGQTGNMNMRSRAHFAKLEAGYHHSKKLQKAYNRYGRASFYVEVLERNVVLQDAELKEIEWINYFNSIDNGYNTRPGRSHCVPCFYNGVQYKSMADAARANGRNIDTMRNHFSRKRKSSLT